MRKFNFLALAANYRTYPPSQASPLRLSPPEELRIKRERVRRGLELGENKLLELKDLKSNFPSGVSKEPMKVPKGECLALQSLPGLV